MSEQLPTLDPRSLATRFGAAMLRATGAGRELVVGKQRFRVHHERVFSVVQIAVAAQDPDIDYTGRIVAPFDLLIERVTARSSDVDGLDGVRIGWTDDADQSVNFIKPNEQAQLVYPVASTILTGAETGVELPAWDIPLLKDQKRTFIARWLSGAVPLTIDLTLHMRRLVRVG